MIFFIVYRCIRILVVYRVRERWRNICQPPPTTTVEFNRKIPRQKWSTDDTVACRTSLKAVEKLVRHGGRNATDAVSTGCFYLTAADNNKPVEEV